MILASSARTLSGTLGKNLMDIEFATQQVVDGGGAQALMTLKNSLPGGRGSRTGLLPKGHRLGGWRGTTSSSRPGTLRRAVPLQGRREK